MLTPLLAPVRPRVLSPITGSSVWLDEEILALHACGERGLVALVGPSRSGKTTALRDLKARLPRDVHVWMIDEAYAAIPQVGSFDQTLALLATSDPAACPSPKYS